MKHAYLILAHTQPDVFRILVEMLDDVRNDIYVHVDKKSDISPFLGVRTQYSRLMFTRRIRNYWGATTQMDAEYILIHTAFANGTYDYYHLLSGADLPIKSNEQINAFFQTHQGYEFVGYAKNSGTEEDIDNKTRYYFWDTPCRVRGFRRLTRILQHRFMAFQRKIDYRREYPMAIKKGSQWVSISGDCCRYLIENEAFLKRMFRWTSCSDELFIQTAIFNSSFRDKVWHFAGDEFESCLRLIDWNRGEPYCWTIDDFNEIISSDRFYVRKITEPNMDLAIAIKNSVLS